MFLKDILYSHATLIQTLAIKTLLHIDVTPCIFAPTKITKNNKTRP